MAQNRPHWSLYTSAGVIHADGLHYYSYFVIPLNGYPVTRQCTKCTHMSFRWCVVLRTRGGSD